MFIDNLTEYNLHSQYLHILDYNIKINNEYLHLYLKSMDRVAFQIIQTHNFGSFFCSASSLKNTTMNKMSYSKKVCSGF